MRRLAAVALLSAAGLASVPSATGAIRPGALDARYGTCGTLAIPSQRDFSGRTLVARAPGGLTAIAGDGSGLDVLAVRLRADGSPDPTFGSGGQATLRAGNEGESVDVRDVAVQPDGRVVVAGSISRSADDIVRPLLVRFTATGVPDATFAAGGRLSAGPPGARVTKFGAVALDASARVVVAGERDERFAVARYLQDGRLDTSFGSGGIALPATPLHPAAANDLAVLPNGGLLAAGFEDEQFAVVRLQSGGAPDATFGLGGWNFDSPPAAAAIDTLAVSRDGSITVAGTGANINEGNIAVGRYSPSGVIDRSFGRDGFVLEPGAAEAGALVLRPDGGVLVRSAMGNSSGGVIRYRADGSRDTSFGRRGVASGRSQGSSGGMVLQPDGALLVPHTTSEAGPAGRLAVDRHLIAEPGLSSASGQPTVCGVTITSTSIKDVLSRRYFPFGLATEFQATESRWMRVGATATIGQRTFSLTKTRARRIDGGRTLLFLKVSRKARAALSAARRADFVITASDLAGRRLAVARTRLGR